MIKIEDRNDNQGRKYHKVTYDKDIPCVITLNGTNLKVTGTPRIVLRTGDSKFGEEVLFEFFITSFDEEYPTNSKWNCTEYYLTKDEAINFLKTALEELNK